MSTPRASIERIEARALVIPNENGVESDGTLEWSETTIVIVQAFAGGISGLGYTYTDKSAAELVTAVLRDVVCGRDAMAVSAAYWAMVRRVRNLGRSGLAQTAISAVDAALWDLKARLLDLPLVTLLGQVHEAVPLYGSGGFTSETEEELEHELSDYLSQSLVRVKMKIGRDPDADLQRVHLARQTVGPDVDVYVDANGAYSRKKALFQADRFAEEGVSWFEEPVSSDDLEGLRLIRDRAPSGMNIAAGEYGYDAAYFQRMLDHGAVDVLQADASRCSLSGWFVAAALCRARSMHISTHCAPSLHLHPACATENLMHVEYFRDHIRIERMLFDGVVSPVSGSFAPDLSRAGMGLTLRRAEAKRFAA